MAAGRPRGPNDPSLMSSLETAVRKVHRPGPVEVAWNWRWELGILATLGALSALIATSIGLNGLAVTAGAGLAVSAAALLCWPPARQCVIARAWCVITPHRVRAGCLNAWVQTRSGRLPIVLATTPTDYGEQVRLWLRAGITAADLYAARDVLAAACWAMEVRVVPSSRHAHLVTLEVVRTHHPERVRPTPQAWPYSRRVADDSLGDAEERDTRSWPGGMIPPPRLSPEEDRPGQVNPAPGRVDVPSQAPVSLAVSSRSLTERTRSCATSMTSRDCLASPAAFLALMASPSMTMQ
jgi:hypothetical protein